MLNLDLKNHPYEVKYNGLVKEAKENLKVREASPPRQKEIPAHIFTVFDQDENLWGMFNKRLGEWVGRGEERTRFRTAERAQDWYRSLI